PKSELPLQFTTGAPASALRSQRVLASARFPQESDRVAPNYRRGRLTLLLCPGYDTFPPGAPANEVRDMESAERRRRIAIAEASDKLWNGEITRSAFLQICARAGIGLAVLATLSSPRRAA